MTIDTISALSCVKCRLSKPPDAFYKNKYRRSGHSSVCKECGRERKRRDRRKNKLATRYNLTLEQYQQLLDAQGGVCAICHQPETHISGIYRDTASLSVDHNHSTGQVRGLLCNNCNTGIGVFRENEALLHSAIDYLKGWELHG